MKYSLSVLAVDFNFKIQTSVAVLLSSSVCSQPKHWIILIPKLKSRFCIESDGLVKQLSLSFKQLFAGMNLRLECFPS